MIPEKYLPIGTVVLLKGAKKRLMITGFCSADAANPDKMFDYSGCMYPEGFLSSEQTALFNHDQIDTIFHMGPIDSEELEFKKKLKELLADKENNPVAPTVAPAPEPVASEPLPTPAPMPAPSQPASGMVGFPRVNEPAPMPGAPSPMPAQPTQTVGPQVPQMPSQMQ